MLFILLVVLVNLATNKWLLDPDERVSKVNYTMIDIRKIPSPADRIVNEFASRLLAIKDNYFLDIFLAGSIPLNDFYPNKSDIDFLITCSTFPDEHMIKKLRKVHRDLERKFPKPDLSGSYIEASSLFSKDINSIKVLSYQNGRSSIQNLEMAPVILFELKSNALTVYGKEAKALPIQIDPAVLNRFLFENINSYWKNWIKRYSSWSGLRLLLILFPRLTEWSVLGVARQLCTLQTGRIVSKTEAGYYCLQHLRGQFDSILNEAIEIRKDDRSYPLLRTYAIRPSFRRAEQTIKCVNAMIAEFNQRYIK